jgi:hydroxycarboxylate dehydrogenase B
MNLTFHKEPLTRAIEAVVSAGGSEPREAKLVAENLVMANLLGHDSHGVGMIPRYVDALLEGGLLANRHPKVQLDAGALLALDGSQGYGQVIGYEATVMAIERAQRHGSCIMTLGRSHHLGRIGQWGEQAVAQGLISLHFVNVISRSIVAPYGGADARFGTNPVCIAIPLAGEPPFVLDMATSAVAQGKVRVAHNKGEKVSPDWLIDDKGNPTSEARFGVIEPFGALRTFGLHKGYGLALACELLGGALSGGGTWHSEDRSKRRVWNGMLSILIDPARLDSNGLFEKETREFLVSLRASPIAPGFDKLRIAGDPEREMKAKREKVGIPVDPTTWDEINAAGAKLGVAKTTIDRLARGG